MNFTIIVPCYNEEAVLPETTQRLAAVIERLLQLKKISSGSILYVDAVPTILGRLLRNMPHKRLA